MQEEEGCYVGYWGCAERYGVAAEEIWESGFQAGEAGLRGGFVSGERSFEGEVRLKGSSGSGTGEETEHCGGGVGVCLYLEEELHFLGNPSF